MDKSKQIKSKMALVKDILTSEPLARDDDRMLVSIVWQREQPMLFNYGKAEAVLRALRKRELTMPDDITRARRKLQELHPELRITGGAKLRRMLAEVDVRQNINKRDEEETDLFTNIGFK